MGNIPAEVYVSPFLIQEEANHLDVYIYNQDDNIHYYKGIVAYKDSPKEWIIELNQWLSSYNVTKVIFDNKELEFEYNLWLNINDESL